MAYGTFTLKGQHTTPTSTPHKGKVSVRPNAIIRDLDGEVIMSGAVSVDLDETGAWTVTLPAGDDARISPSEGLGYVVSYRLQSQSFAPETAFVAAQPTGSTFDVSQIVTSDPTTAVSTVAGPPGDPGASAYDVAVAEGFVGTQAEWLASLAGPGGDPGDPGEDGAPGEPGEPGPGLPPGGEPGQVPVKASRADYDTAWADPPVGVTVAKVPVTPFPVTFTELAPAPVGGSWTYYGSSVASPVAHFTPARSGVATFPLPRKGIDADAGAEWAYLSIWAGDVEGVHYPAANDGAWAGPGAIAGADWISVAGVAAADTFIEVAVTAGQVYTVTLFGSTSTGANELGDVWDLGRMLGWIEATTSGKVYGGDTASILALRTDGSMKILNTYEGAGSRAFATKSATASGTDSAALARGSATGTRAFAAGGGTAGGEQATALGGGIASNYRAFAVGSTASGQRAFAAGSASATADNTVAMGQAAAASALNAVALGASAAASAQNAMALGPFAKATSSSSFAAGDSVETRTPGEVALGSWAHGTRSIVPFARPASPATSQAIDFRVGPQPTQRHKVTVILTVPSIGVKVWEVDTVVGVVTDNTTWTPRFLAAPKITVLSAEPGTETATLTYALVPGAAHSAYLRLTGTSSPAGYWNAIDDRAGSGGSGPTFQANNYLTTTYRGQVASPGQPPTKATFHAGGIFIGYGDLNENTGPVDVLRYDTTADTAATLFPAMPTEEVSAYRVYGGNVYAPWADSRPGTPQGGYTTNEGGTWHNVLGPDMIHTMDVAVHAGDHYLAGSAWLAGSPAGVIYKSTDDGATWTLVHSHSPGDHYARVDSLVSDGTQLWAIIRDTSGVALHKSTDAGATWPQVRSAFPSWGPIFANSTGVVFASLGDVWTGSVQVANPGGMRGATQVGETVWIIGAQGSVKTFAAGAWVHKGYLNLPSPPQALASDGTTLWIVTADWRVYSTPLPA